MARLTQDQVVAGLVQRGVPSHVAQGVALNFRDESAFNTGIQELNPHSGRGGYGLAQWTGPRRVALENFAASQGRPSDDPDVQLDYFMRENAGPEAPAWQKVMSAATPQEAAVNFVNAWERPAAQHAAARTAKYQGVGGAGVAVNDPNPNRTTPWHGPAEVDPSHQGTAMADALMARGAEKKSLGATAADAIANINWGGNPLPKAALPVAPAAAARADAPEVPPVIAAADPARRQELAAILARLNKGVLV